MTLEPCIGCSVVASIVETSIIVVVTLADSIGCSVLASTVETPFVVVLTLRDAVVDVPNRPRNLLM